MREIGGYMDLERYQLPMLHEDGIKLNCGRNCLAYLIVANKIRKIVLPYFMCESVIDLCRKYDVSVRFYHIGIDFKPQQMEIATDEWFYLMNYYGQLTDEDIMYYKHKYSRIIVDNAHAYFDEPVKGVDTLYTCRKFFGVVDGAILYTNVMLAKHLEQDESYKHMEFLLGRFERNGTEFYSLMLENNKRLGASSMKYMSKLTYNLLHSIDYAEIKKRRTENYMYLADKLGDGNKLKLRMVSGAFAYPFYIENGEVLRKELIKHKIYVPVLWPNVLQETAKNSIEYKLAADLLPIPCDQRYGIEDMEFICKLIKDFYL